MGPSLFREYSLSRVHCLTSPTTTRIKAGTEGFSDRRESTGMRRFIPSRTCPSQVVPSRFDHSLYLISKVQFALADLRLLTPLSNINLSFLICGSENGPLFLSIYHCNPLLLYCKCSFLRTDGSNNAYEFGSFKGGAPRYSLLMLFEHDVLHLDRLYEMKLEIRFIASSFHLHSYPTYSGVTG